MLTKRNSINLGSASSGMSPRSSLPSSPLQTDAVNRAIYDKILRSRLYKNGAQGQQTHPTTEESTTLKHKMEKTGASNQKVIAL